MGIVRPSFNPANGSVTFCAGRISLGLGCWEFGLGLGNFILFGNVILLWLYTASCHSCRSIIGGKLNHFSQHPVRYKLWGWVSKLNGRHKLLAWVTLGTLAITDFYIWGLAADWYSDPRIIN